MTAPAERKDEAARDDETLLAIAQRLRTGDVPRAKTLHDLDEFERERLGRDIGYYAKRAAEKRGGR